MMVIEGGLLSRMQVMDAFSGAYEDVLRACQNLGKCYEDMKDSGNCSALSNELEAIEEDFTELKGLVRGYLSNASNSSVKERTEQLKQEVSKREADLSRIEQEIERTYAECKIQLGQKLRSEGLPIELDQEAWQTDHSGDREQESKKKLGELNECLSSKELIKEQNSGVQKQPVVSSSTHVPIISTAVGRDIRIVSAFDGRYCLFVYSVYSV